MEQTPERAARSDERGRAAAVVPWKVERGWAGGEPGAQRAHPKGALRSAGAALGRFHRGANRPRRSPVHGTDRTRIRTGGGGDRPGSRKSPCRNLHRQPPWLPIRWIVPRARACNRRWLCRLQRPSRQPRRQPPPRAMSFRMRSPRACDQESEMEEAVSASRSTRNAMINCRADLNQLVPFKYDWAWQKYLDGCANHWMPQEVNMTADVIAVEVRCRALTADERVIVKRNLGFFSTADSLVANNLVLVRVPAHHQPGVPPVPVAPSVRGGDPHPRLPILHRVPRHG